MIKKYFFAGIILLFVGATHAQSTLNSTGNSKIVNSNTYSYSIGEMVLVHTATANNIVVTQGVLQSASSPVGIETVKITADELIVYPNPTRDVLNLQVNIQEKANLSLKLYDISGKELISKEWKTTASIEEMQLNLQEFAAGNYILNVQYKKSNNSPNAPVKKPIFLCRQLMKNRTSANGLT